MSDLTMTCPNCGSHTTAIGQAARDGEPCPYCSASLPEGRDDGVTAKELLAALRATDGEEFQRDWPYIPADLDIIDGDLPPVVHWLVKHYRITPRDTPQRLTLALSDKCRSI